MTTVKLKIEPRVFNNISIVSLFNIFRAAITRKRQLKTLG